MLLQYGHIRILQIVIIIVIIIKVIERKNTANTHWKLFSELRTQKLGSHLVSAQSLIVLPLKPGVGPYIAIHATLTARDFFLAYFYPSGPFTCIFPKTSPVFSFLCKPAEYNRSPYWMQVPVLSARGMQIGLKKTNNLYDDLLHEKLGDSVKFVFSPDVILWGWLGSKHQTN